MTMDSQINRLFKKKHSNRWFVSDAKVCINSTQKITIMISTQNFCIKSVEWNKQTNKREQTKKTKKRKTLQKRAPQTTEERNVSIQTREVKNHNFEHKQIHQTSYNTRNMHRKI